ncbi:hypothetical protein XBKQ1_1300005 [Xenorhabdus bovienii str. kraussei Quebec]|uniref:Uncharacterized protein n=1 Tax=Xenorhabdus bovienii str. kraussei Quebec TaxID=1398203 RepID=A0A077PD00_XENBV|nr:hypothetical protein XBKQ1_1300005 [Xenorhabdus bovienii str. kraussei Quebec]
MFTIIKYKTTPLFVNKNNDIIKLSILSTFNLNFRWLCCYKYIFK